MPSSSPDKARVAIAFACVYLCWGTTYGAIHIAVQYIAPPLVGALRSFLSLAIFVAVCVGRGLSLRVSRREAWQLAIVGILMMSVNNVLLVWAESMVASGWASVIIAMIPILVAVIETALPNGETLNLRGWLGTLLGAAGILALLWPSLHGMAQGQRTAHNLHTLLGFSILLVAAFAFAAGSILGRRFRFRMEPFVATAWQIGAAGLTNLTISAAGGTFRTARYTPAALLSLAWLSIVGSLVGLTAYTYLLQHVPVTKVSTYAFVNPVIAVLIGVVVFHERLARAEIVGIIMILIAVATVILSRTRTTTLDSDPDPAV